MSKEKDKTIEKDGIKFRVLETGFFGLNMQLLLLRSHSVEIPFAVPDIILSQPVRNFPKNICSVYIRNKVLYIDAGLIWDGSSGPSLDTFTLFSAKWCMAYPSLIHDCMADIWTQGAIQGNSLFNRTLNDEWYFQNCIKSGMVRLRAHWQYAAVYEFSRKKQLEYCVLWFILRFSRHIPQRSGKLFLV